MFADALAQDTLTEIRTATNESFALGTERFQREISAMLGPRTWRGRPERPGDTEVGPRYTEAIKTDIRDVGARDPRPARRGDREPWDRRQTARPGDARHRISDHEMPSCHEAFSWYCALAKIGRLGLLSSIRTVLSRNPITVLIGPRQCGKTTLARELLSEDSINCFDLEDPASLACLGEPMTALTPLQGLVAIDEVQSGTWPNPPAPWA